jgi:hypothetical protein
MLNDKKCSSVKFVASSSNVASTFRTTFFKPKMCDSKGQVTCLDKGKSVCSHDHVKFEYKIHVITVVSVVILDHIVFRFNLRNLGLKRMFLGKMNLVLRIN